MLQPNTSYLLDFRKTVLYFNEATNGLVWHIKKLAWLSTWNIEEVQTLASNEQGKYFTNTAGRQKQ
jgi:hypothetical protein